MRLYILLKLSLVFLANVTIANAAVLFDTWEKANVISPFYGCKYAVTNVALYCDTDQQYYFDCQCEDTVAIGTMAYCAITNNVNLKNFVNTYNENCVPLGYSKFTEEDIKTSYANVTKYIKSAEEYGSFNYTGDILRTPIAFTAFDYKIGFDTYYDYYQNCSWAIIFGFVSFGLWLLIFTIGGIYQLLFRYLTNNSLVRLHNATWFKIYKEPVSIFGIELGYFVVNKLDTLVLAANLLIYLVGSCWNYHSFEGNFFWAKRNAQISRYVGDRTGYLCMFPLNLAFLFAMRNNFLLWCTGWNFASFLNYHKFMSRIAILLAAAHGIAYWIFSVQDGDYAEAYEDAYWVAGVYAMVIGAAIVICANYTLVRKKLYEIFLILHIAMAVVFVVGIWYHLNPLEDAYYIIPVIGVWSLDRLIRLVRMFVIFGGYRSNKITIFKNNNGDNNDIFLRLDVDNFNKKLFKIKDGNFCFVYFATPLGFWQSHPFTIVKINENKNFSIIIKVKKGITSKIYNSILSSGQNSKNFKISIEGPYGSSKKELARQYDNLSVVAVGSGIAGPIGYLNHHRNTNVEEDNKNKNTLYWGVKSLNIVEAFMGELKILTMQNKNIQVFIYCKNLEENESDISDTKSTETVSSNTLLKILGPSVSIFPGYLNAYECVDNAFSENNSLLIMTCGLPKVCDETRYQFLKNLTLNQKKGSYNFVDESQVW